ncbi:MAG TPA: ribosome silencing factor [Acidimicrobiia bacterium]|nr:ribosome silencing factor [Acidimicrobiia bacterium]
MGQTVLSSDSHPTPGGTTDAAHRAIGAARAADAKLGTNTVVLEVGDIIAITEWFVITSAPNTRQVRTICDEVEAQLKELAGIGPVSVEGLAGASWVLLDYGDVVVHVFLDETREYFDLERLWADAPRLDWSAEPAASAAAPT